MRSFITIILILILKSLSGQNILNIQKTKNEIFVSRIIEYKPAPGQFINTSAWGTPTKAESIIGGVSGGISLGAYGGYIIVGFNKSLENDPENPYGIDFTVFGNPLEEWSEPGIIMVMKDENQNGIADDTWYEIVGSDHYWESTIKNYSLSYTNPNSEVAADVEWIDNQNDTGYVYANEFHLQPYYPSADLFPDINQESYGFSGTRIKGFVDKTIPTYIMSFRRGFGYADNFPRGSAPYDVPDNPYTPEKEGCGGDPIDIDWAVDSKGNPANLDQIDFVKIYTAINEEAGWLGEVSTEITAVMDVTPNPSITGEENLFVLNDLPPQVSAGTILKLEANFFIKGKIQNAENIEWSVDKPLKARIDENNYLTAIDTGKIIVTAKYNNGTTYTKTINTDIIAPDKIILEFEQNELRVGDILTISAKVMDQNGHYFYGLENIWSSSNDNIAIEQNNDTYQIQGKKEGKSKLYVHPKGFENIKDSVEITVLKAPDKIQVYLSIKSDKGIVFTRSKIEVTNFNLSPFITNPNLNYGLHDIPVITLAHVVASVFENIEFESDLRFADKPEGNLYISQLPVNVGNNIEYYYGSGGYEDNAWIIKHNNAGFVHGFADIQVSEGDEVFVYYIDNVHFPWCIYQVDFIETTVETGKTLDISASCDSYHIENSSVTSNGIIPAISVPVIVNDEEYSEDGIFISTDNNGKAHLHFKNTGEYLVRIATEKYHLIVENGITGIEKLEASFKMYPNPADQYISIKANNITSEPVDIFIYSSTGILKYQNHFQLFTEITINTNTWTNGIYFIQIKDSDKIISKKIIINH